MELNEIIKLMKFDTNTDINIFLANLQNHFDELEKIDNDILQSTKIGKLKRWLPENLRFINVFQYSDWKDCCWYVKKVIPEILLSNTKESNNLSETATTTIFNINKNSNDSNKNKNINKQNSNKHTKNGRCNYCDRKGHYFYECKYRKRNKKYRRKHFRKSKN